MPNILLLLFKAVVAPGNKALRNWSFLSQEAINKKQRGHLWFILETKTSSSSRPFCFSLYQHVTELQSTYGSWILSTLSHGQRECYVPWCKQLWQARRAKKDEKLTRRALEAKEFFTFPSSRLAKRELESFQRQKPVETSTRFCSLWHLYVQGLQGHISMYLFMECLSRVYLRMCLARLRGLKWVSGRILVRTEPGLPQNKMYSNTERSAWSEFIQEQFRIIGDDTGVRHVGVRRKILYRAWIRNITNSLKLSWW